MNLLKVVSVLTLASLSIAGTASQIDWSGGDGLLGPLNEWGNRFYSSTDVSWFQAPGRIAISLIAAHQITYDCREVFSAASADIDGDGDTDVITADARRGKFFWYENRYGSGLLWTKRTVNLFGMHWPICVNSMDIDGDGDMDVIGADRVLGVRWWENEDGSGTSWVRHDLFEAYGTRCIVSVDMDKDGDIDIVVSQCGSASVSWFENTDGSGSSWILHQIGTDDQHPYTIYVEDIDGDNDLDVAGALYYHENDIVWWENTDEPDSNWVKHVVDDDFYHANSVFCEDIDGDGDMDILGAANGIAWWENNDGSGGTSWTKHYIGFKYAGAYSVLAQDMDMDGDIDILGAVDGIAWWENSDSAGSNWIRHNIDEYFDGPVAIYSDDINGDGTMDILAASYDTWNIAWWDITDSSYVGVLESSILQVSDSPDWKYFQCNSTEPPGTELMFQFRTSDDPENMGVWSDTLWSPDSLSGVIPQGQSLFQYKVIMTTDNLEYTPTLFGVYVFWEPYTGIETESNTQEYSLHGPQPNPSTSNVVIHFNVPEDTGVDLIIFDLSGRIIESIHDYYIAGEQQVAIGNLPSGVYITRMLTDKFSASRRFTVIE